MIFAEIRPYPWPFKAALSISNDCDFLTLDAMLALHRLFQTSADAGGFGLELSDSFFFYKTASKWPNYSYFEGLSKAETKAAPLIRTLVGKGYLDTTHALGDFESGGFRRELARIAVDNFASHGLKLPVWSNHGGYGNRQNIGRRDFCYYHGGDDFHGPHYILDLIEELGVRYIWTDVSKSKWMSLQPRGPVATERERKAPRALWMWPRRQTLETYVPVWNYDRREVFETIETRVGSKLQGFIRYDGFLPDGDCGVDKKRLITPDGRRVGPNIGRLAISLTGDKLDKLVKEQACVFLYQHLSTLAHLPDRTHLTRDLEFHPENVESLKSLKKREEQGEIWVAAQAILLDYLYMLNTVEVQIDRSSTDTVALQLRIMKGYEYRGCSGLTVEIGNHPVQSHLMGPDGRIIPCHTVGPDERGVYFAHVPIRRLPGIDWRALAAEHGVAMNDRLTISELDGSRAVDLFMPDQKYAGKRLI